MSAVIRKISVGEGYPNGALHYQLKHKLNLNGTRYEICGIYLDGDLLAMNKIAYNIYIKNVPEFDTQVVAQVLWKTVIDVPCVVENNIDFE